MNLLDILQQRSIPTSPEVGEIPCKNKKRLEAKVVIASLGNAYTTSMLVEFGEQAIIYSPLHTILGYVSEGGLIYDRSRNLLGSVSRQGVVRNRHSHVVGVVNLKQDRFPFRAATAAFFLLQKAQEV